MGLDSLQMAFSRAGTLADCNHTLNSPLLADISNAGCLRGYAADFQGDFVACQHPPQEAAAGAAAALKLSLPAKSNLVHIARERERFFWVV